MQGPALPFRFIIFWFSKLAEMPESPGNLIAIPFIIAISPGFRAQDFCYFPRHTRLFSNTNFHEFPFTFKFKNTVFRRLFHLKYYRQGPEKQKSSPGLWSCFLYYK